MDAVSVGTAVPWRDAEIFGLAFSFSAEGYVKGPGEEDPIASPGAARGLAERIKGAKLKTLPRCGHWTPIEQPKECARLAAEHIRAHA